MARRDRKDREWAKRIADRPDLRIQFLRSSDAPVEYFIALQAFRRGEWRNLIHFDNSHGPLEHHEHRYGPDKLSPTVRYGPINEAMAGVIARIEAEWPDILDDWEQSQ